MPRIYANESSEGSRFPRTQGQRSAMGQGGPFIKVMRGTFVGNVAGFYLRPGNGYRWRVISGRLSMVTSGTVANRQLKVFAVDENDNYFLCMLQAPTQTASLTKGYQFGPSGIGQDSVGAATLSEDTYIAPLSMPIPLCDQMGIMMGVAAGVVTDIVTYSICVEEMRGWRQ